MTIRVCRHTCRLLPLLIYYCVVIYIPVVLLPGCCMNHLYSWGKYGEKIKQANKKKRKTVYKRILQTQFLQSTLPDPDDTQSDVTESDETITDSGSTFRGFCAPITSMYMYAVNAAVN